MLIYNVVCVSMDTRLTSTIKTILCNEGHELHLFPSMEQAAGHTTMQQAELVLLDSPRATAADRPRLEGLIQRLQPQRVVVVLDAGDMAGLAYFQAIGVRSVLQRPLMRHDLEGVLASLDQSPSTIEPPSSSAPCVSSDGALLEELDHGRFFLAASEKMREIYDNIRILAPIDVPVLILGESGVGKEIIASLLHRFSTRASQSFVNVNCAALPAELLESELFGYEPGAFTGATKAKPGKFEIAHRGTILLDEIGEMSAPMQAKLLHVLQDGQFSRLGARTSTRVSVRVLAATNIDMDAAIEERRFREDLYYRLNAFAITVPSLRERREEIPLLLKQMFRRQAVELDRPAIQPTEAMLTAAQEYSWPGNLRELRNFVTRTLVLRDEKNAIQELQTRTVGRRRGPSSATSPYGAPPVAVSAAPASAVPAGRLGMPLAVREVKDQAESRLINEALLASNWNRRRAATHLQISYRSLLYKIQQYDLAPMTDRLSLQR